MIEVQGQMVETRVRQALRGVEHLEEQYWKNGEKKVIWDFEYLM